MLKKVAFGCLLLAFWAAPALRGAPEEGVSSKDGLVVCTSSPACDAGAGVLAKGGTAVDAAVATAFALAVTHPSAGNIGGGTWSAGDRWARPRRAGSGEGARAYRS